MVARSRIKLLAMGLKYVIIAYLWTHVECYMSAFIDSRKTDDVILWKASDNIKKKFI